MLANLSSVPYDISIFAPLAHARADGFFRGVMLLLVSAVRYTRLSQPRRDLSRKRMSQETTNRIARRAG